MHENNRGLGKLRRTLSVLWSASGSIARERKSARIVHRFRYLLKSVPNLAVLSRFINAENNKLVKEIADSHAVLKAIVRPYIHAGWSLEQRVAAVEAHYRAIAKGPAELLDFSHRCYWDCATISLKEQRLRIVIDRPSWMRAEGEIAASLFLGINRIYIAAFSIHGEWPRCTMVIGAIQGKPDDPESKKLYADLTSELHGIRPRDLMVHVVKMIARAIGCTEILAISDNFHQTAKGGNKKRSNYDQIWAENGGVQNDDGFYVLPLIARKREAADIPVRKRAQYRRRYAMLDELELQVHEAFNRPTRTLQMH